MFPNALLLPQARPKKSTTLSGRRHWQTSAHASLTDLVRRVPVYGVPTPNRKPRARYRTWQHARIKITQKTHCHPRAYADLLLGFLPSRLKAVHSLLVLLGRHHPCSSRRSIGIDVQRETRMPFRKDNIFSQRLPGRFHGETNAHGETRHRWRHARNLPRGQFWHCWRLGTLD